MVHVDDVGFLNRQYTGIFSLKYRQYRYISAIFCPPIYRAMLAQSAVMRQ